MVRYQLLAVLAALLLSVPAHGQVPSDISHLAPAPELPPGLAPYIPPGTPPVRTRSATSVSVDPFNRAAVAALYRDVYAPQSSAVIDSVNVNIGTCNAGTTPLAIRQAVIERVNVFRALAGLPGTVTLFGAPEQDDDQAAALIMVANFALDHTPPGGWTCWTQAGYDGASRSNLTLGGSSGPGYAYNGAAAIRGYMDDSGGGNAQVGHRRWLLYPPQAQMATGDTYTDAAPGSYPYASSNALWVTGGPGYVFGPRPPTPNGTAWPPRGYVPWQLLPTNSNRWSFSYPGADFTTAIVTMTENGVPVPVTIVADSSGAGDPAIVWEPAFGAVDYDNPPASDIPYQITVIGVTGNGPTSFSYTVRVIDPYDVSDVIFADGFE